MQTKFNGDQTDVTALVKYAKDLEAENDRLRRGIQNYLDGNYDHPRAHRHEPAMGCKHGQHYYEECGECDAAYFSALLGETVQDETNLAARANA